jgi:hypothetical protein
MIAEEKQGYGDKKIFLVKNLKLSLYVFILVIFGGKGFADLGDLVLLNNTEMTAKSTTSTTLYDEVAKIGSEQITANTDYFIYASVGLSGSDAHAIVNFRVEGDYGAMFTGGAETDNADSKDAKQMTYVTTYTTDASPNDVNISFKCSTSLDTCYAGNAQILMLDLTDLTEKRDYYNASFSGDTFLTLDGDIFASVTLDKADGAKDWLVFASGVEEVDGTASKFRMSISDGTSEYMKFDVEGEDFSFETLAWTLFNTFENVAANTIFSLNASVDISADSHDLIEAHVFAIDLSVFESSTFVYNSEGILIPATTLGQIESINHTPVSEGQTIIFSNFIADIDSADSGWEDDITVDGTINPVGWDWTQTDFTRKTAYDATDEWPNIIMANETIATDGSNITVRAADLTGDLGNALEISITSFSAKLALMPVIQNNYTIPSFPKRYDNVTFYANVSDLNSNVLSVNFTIIDPSGTKVVNNLNGSNNGGQNWNTTYNLTSYGTWLWNISAFDGDGFIVNSSTGEIILLEVSVNLNDTSIEPNTQDPVYVSGKINLSNGTNVSNNKVSVWVNGTTANISNDYLTLNTSVIESSSSEWDLGTAVNVSVNTDNITLKVNGSNQYPNQTGNFSSKIIDTGNTNANFSLISWSTDTPYQTEIGRSVGDGNSASDGEGFINTSGLVLLMHFNNETGENGSLVKDYSINVNSERGGSVHNNGTCSGITCPTYNFTDRKFGGGAMEFNGSGDYIDAGNDTSLNITAAITIAAWVKSNSEGYIVVKDPPDTGFKDPASSGEDYDQFTSPTNAFSSDDAYATETSDAQQQDYFDFTFGLSSETIEGIELVIEAKSGAWFSSHWSIDTEISWDGGTSYTTSSKGTGELTTSDADYTMGGATDTWGRSWTASELSDANFRVKLNAQKDGATFQTLSVDHVKMKVYYTATVVSKNTSLPFALSTVNGGEFLIINNSNFYRANSSTDVNDGNWHHMAATFNGSEMRLYVDGSLESNTSYVGVLPQNSYAVWIGRNYSADSLVGYFNGSIDEVAIWNRSLPAKEVSNLYKRGALSLNLSVRSCDDNACSGETFSEILDNQTLTPLNGSITPNNRYFQYKAIFNTEGINYTPVLYNVTINYTTTGTDSFGNYNFTFKAPSGVGTYPLKVNTTFGNFYGENSVDLTVEAAGGGGDTTVPIINGSLNQSLASIFQNDGVNATFNMTDESNSINGSIVINKTGVNEYFNFSFVDYVAGTTQQISQNFTISEAAGVVINITGIAIDNSSNRNQNETIFTVAAAAAAAAATPAITQTVSISTVGKLVISKNSIMRIK